MMKSENQRGFILIELMIGMVIGLLTTLAIVQVQSFSENQRRNSMAGSDALVSGTVSLFLLQREIREAGYGLSANPAAMGCPISFGVDKTGKELTSTLAPVVITQGTAGAADTISILSSTQAGPAVSVRIENDYVNTASNVTVKSTFGVAVGNYLLAVPEKWSGTATCAMMQVTQVVDGQNLKLSAIGTFPTSGYAAGSSFINLGQDFHSRTFSVTQNTRVLQVDTDGSSAQVISPEIVNLQAFYAMDTNADGAVDAYTTTLPTTAAAWAQVLAIRVAIVARNAEYQKEEVTSAAPEWDVGKISITGAADCSSSTGKCSLGVSQLTDWKHYRYRVYDTTVPLRNVLWNS